jgi:hypothetical protein
MMNRATSTSWIAHSTRIYRTLLMLYPADYRREYGALMVQVFRDVARDKYGSSGLIGMALWWCSTLLDLTLTVIEQRKGRFGMSKSTYMQLAGMLLIVGGAFMMLASFSQLQPGDHYSYTGIYRVLLWMIAPSFILLGLGLIALALRYEMNVGMFGKWLLIVCGVSSLVMGAGVGVSMFREDWWNIWYVTSLVHVGALTLFGVLHGFKPSLPVFRWLPLMTASGWWFMFLGIAEPFPQSTENLLSFIIFLGMGLGWLAIGQAVNRQRGAAVLAAA